MVVIIKLSDKDIDMQNEEQFWEYFNNTLQTRTPQGYLVSNRKDKFESGYNILISYKSIIRLKTTSLSRRLDNPAMSNETPYRIGDGINTDAYRHGVVLDVHNMEEVDVSLADFEEALRSEGLIDDTTCIANARGWNKLDDSVLEVLESLKVQA